MTLDWLGPVGIVALGAGLWFLWLAGFRVDFGPPVVFAALAVELFD